MLHIVTKKNKKVQGWARSPERRKTKKQETRQNQKTRVYYKPKKKHRPEGGEETGPSLTREEKDGQDLIES